MGTKEPSGEWWASIIHAFQAHVREETAFLEKYQEAVAGVDDAALRFLLEMILEDERRHHALFEQMAEVGLMEIDTQKHVTILEYVQKRLRVAAKS